MKPIREQQEILDAVLSGINVNVNATPGGGKTTILCQLDATLKTPLFTALTFSKSLAEDVASKFHYGNVSTLHGYLHQANKRFLQAHNITPQVQRVDDKFKRSYVNPDLLSIVTHRYLKEFYGLQKAIPAIIKPEFYTAYNQIQFLVDKIRAQAINYRNEILVHSIFDAAYNPTVVDDAINVLKKLTEHFEKRAEYDFGGMLYIPAMFPELEKYIVKPKHLAIDETNDSNPLMQLCYQKIASEGTQVILVGDSNQAIHMWAGCKPDAIQKLGNYFKAVDIAYNITFRVPHKMIAYLNESGLDTQIKAFETNKVGKVENVSLNKMMMTVKDGDWILGRFRRNKNKSLTSLEKLSIDFLTLGRKVRLLGSDYIEVCQAMISKVDNLHKVSFRNVASDVKKAVDKELTKILEDSTKDSWKYRKLEADYEIFSLYFGFYCRKVGMPTAYEFIKFLNTMYENSDDCITLMTYHKSKGREHHTIYLLHVDIINGDIINSELDIPTRLEAKNLLYVGLTRSNDRTLIVDGKLMNSYPELFFQSA